MRVDQIRDLLRAEPFEPFDIHLADGRSLHVPHPEFVALDARGRRLVVLEERGATQIVNPTLITGLSPGDGESGNGEEA